MTIEDEDAGLLKYAGMMGHACVTISGEVGSRRVSCQTNDLESAKRLSAGDAHVRVYSTTGGKRRKWLNCFDADMNALGNEVRKQNGWTT